MWRSADSWCTVDDPTAVSHRGFSELLVEASKICLGTVHYFIFRCSSGGVEEGLLVGLLALLIAVKF